GFAVGTSTKRNDPKPEGTILQQTPAAGVSVARGSIINVVVSAGPGVITPVTVTVPNVVGMGQTDAQAAIESASLRLGATESRSENKPKGTVVTQDLKAGKKVNSSDPVNLTVSCGKLIEVPDIVNDKEQTARKKIEDKHLTVGSVTYRASCEAVGKVLEQSDRHSKVELGSAINLVVGNLGEDPITVPRFIGQSRNDAEFKIREQHFMLANPRTEETDNAQPGTVVNQSPREGTQFARNCPVKIELTLAVPLTTVGNYVGLSEADARRQVSDTGLLASVSYRESQTAPGIVIDQNPPAGNRVRRSFPITLVVSKPAIPQVIVPEVVRMTLIDAKNTLEKVGLRLGTVTYEQPNAAPGVLMARQQIRPCTVVRQDPV